MKDVIVPLFPNIPSRNNKDLHEKFGPKVLSSTLKGCEKISMIVPYDPQLLPALLAKRTIKEEVEGRLFSVEIAKHTIIIVVVHLDILSPKDVSGIKAIHKKKPVEDPQFV